MHYYLYQHRRLDTNTIFYIGIGKKVPKAYQGPKTGYERAYARSKRTDYWKNILNKTDYKVEILLESTDEKFIKEKEIELIKLYGRKCCDKNGILVNFHEGGGGKGDPGPRLKNIQINQYSLTGIFIKTWEQLKDIELEHGYLKTNIVKCCRKKQITAYGYKWAYTTNNKYNTLRASTARKKTTNRGIGIIIIHKQTQEMLTFRTVNECAKYLNLHISTVQKYLTKNKSHKLYNIKYMTW